MIVGHLCIVGDCIMNRVVAGMSGAVVATAAMSDEVVVVQ